jgi:hypothetical protein
MKSLQKQVDLLTTMDANELIPLASNRVELKQVRSGHWRLYIALPGGVPMDKLEPLLKLANEKGLWPNCFPGGPSATAITFVDPDEQKA